MTTKSTVTVNGGAMPKFDRRAIMKRAWAIFCQHYGYPTMPYRSIGRRCFASALRMAWWEVKEAARIAAIPAEMKAARVAELRRVIELAEYNESWPQARREISNARAEISRLSA